MKKPTKRKDPLPDPRSDLGPLPWLVGFANIGFDDRTPRGPDIAQSRFLGYGGWRGEVFFDPQRPHRIESVEPGVERITQEYRDVTKTWRRCLVDHDGKTVMVPDTDGLEAPLTWELLQGFLAEYPPRPIMPIPEGGPEYRVRTRRQEGGWNEYGVVVEIADAPLGEEDPDGLGPIELRLVRNVVRHFLSMAWLLHHRAPGVRVPHFPQMGIRDVFVAIADSCLGEHGMPPSLHRAPKAAAEDLLVKATLGEGFEGVTDLYRIVLLNSGPVRLTMTMSNEDLEQHFVADALPGIVWAEVLNLTSRCHLWSAIEWCAWCGRFFLSGPRRRGRPRNRFDTDTCAKRFHDYAPGEERTWVS